MGQEFSIKPRQVILAEYMIENNSTVRQCAHAFCISKSTVHKDVTEKLKDTNTDLYLKTKLLLEKNKAERHIRGGEATKRKYKSKASMVRKGNRRHS